MVASHTSLSTPSDPSDPAEREAAAAVEALRVALRAADVNAVQAVRWLAPRPPGERDLLSDLAAAEGLERAVEQLSRFWRRAEVRLERVRVIGSLEAEVYERVHLPGESLPIASLVRRAAVGAPWRVVCTNEAHDERFTIWIPSAKPEIDDVAWSRAHEARFGPGAELIMDGLGGVLGEPAYGWLANVRGPWAPRHWPEQLPGEGGRVVELATALTPEVGDRRAQLQWILRAALIFLDQLGGAAAYLPSHEKLVLPQALEAALEDKLAPDQALRFWARVEEIDGHFVTTGLRQLGLPEVEVEVALLGDRDATARLVRWLGAKLIDLGHLPAHGTELVAGDRSFVIVPGRRGPRRGRSYGRWGALRVSAADDRLQRGSRTRIRIPREAVWGR